MNTTLAATASCVRVHIALAGVRDALDRADADDLTEVFASFDRAVAAALLALK